MNSLQTRKLAIIPARSGSKRIPGKNTRNFAGKPVISYTIGAAIDSGLFDEIMVSTDSEEIASLAKNLGANIPFFRSKANSGDHATLAEVAMEVIEKYAENGMDFDYFCCLLPTAPLMNPEKIQEAYQLLLSKDFTSVFPVVAFNYPILRSLKIENGRVTMNWPEHEKSRSQDLPLSYHDAGQFYWLNTKEFLMEKKFFSSNSGAIILNETEVQDIDTEADWILAEMKYEILHAK